MGSNSVCIGYNTSTGSYNGATNIGYGASSNRNNAVALGYYANCTGDYSITIGAFSKCTQSYCVSIGSGEENQFKTRRLINVTDPTNSQDAATKNYVDTKIPNAPTTDGTYTLQVVVSGGIPTYSWI